MGDLEAKLELQPVLEASTSGRVAPFALYFPSGFSPSQETGCKWELQANNAPNADHYIIGRMPSVDMVGHTHSAASGPPACRYAVGVLDRARGTLKYAEVQAGRVVRVEPRARSISYQASGVGAAEGELDRDMAIAQNRRLVDAFGSTRRKRQLQTREGARVQADALGATEAVASLLKSAGDRAVASGATKAEVLGRAMGHRVLPPHDPEAINPQDAYKLDEVIPRAVWASLETGGLREEVLGKVKLEGHGVPDFVRNCLSKISDPDSAEGLRALKGAAYLVAAMKVYHGPLSLSANPLKGGIRATAEKMGVQVDVLQSFLDDFYDSTEQGGFTSYSRSDQRKTLLLMHILVVGLALEGYNMGPRQCDLLRQGLKAHPMLFTSLYRELGCVVKSSAPKMSRATSSPTRELSVVLLPPTDPPKTLGDSFPGIKIGSKRNKK